ncbi:MAG: DUF4861 domain-containing protein [Alistipes sp.]|nr:DUF4861 domain-containing protein [Alistipes sp.]
MKHFLLILAALAVLGTADAGTRKAPKITKAFYRLSCENTPTWAVVRDVPAGAKGATVYLLDARRGRTEIPSQLDDLNGDGVFDELVFPVDLPSGGQADVRVDYFTKEVAHDYKPLVNAQMWWKNPDKTLTEKSQLSSDKDDMYHKLHHHGPAFESEYAAYRIYFDKKQSIDTYGKKQPRLELRETMWYPSDEQLAVGYGHDNLRVFGSISVGALKGWNPAKRRMEHIVDMRRREATIRACGPLRTVVDMRVEGWKYGGREIDMTSRYILYGGGSVVKVENFIEGEAVDDLEFTTGVMKIADNRFHILRTDDSYLLATVGCDFPENDTLKWERETVGLAVWLPAQQVVSQIDDAKSYLCQLRPLDGRIDYWFVMGWLKSGWLEDGLPESSSDAFNMFEAFETRYLSPATRCPGNAPYPEIDVVRVK